MDHENTKNLRNDRHRKKFNIKVIIIMESGEIGFKC